jgi:hypothetical protein
MPKYVIERDMPNVGKITPAELKAAAAKSYKVMRELGSEINWITSYVTENKMYCVFVAPNKDVVIEHARCMDMPVDRISPVTAIADAATGELAA